VVQRADDTPEAVRRRLELYFRETEPLIAFYRERGLLTEVDGDRPIDAVTDAVAAAVNRVDRGAAAPAGARS
jgi:adenylate kinase